jgi:hypothetical protein
LERKLKEEIEQNINTKEKLVEQHLKAKEKMAQQNLNEKEKLAVKTNHMFLFFFFLTYMATRKNLNQVLDSTNKIH